MFGKSERTFTEHRQKAYFTGSTTWGSCAMNEELFIDSFIIVAECRSEKFEWRIKLVEFLLKGQILAENSETMMKNQPGPGFNGPNVARVRLR